MHFPPDALVAGIVAQVEELAGIVGQVEELGAEPFVEDVLPPVGAQHVGPALPGVHVEQGARTPVAEVDLAHGEVAPLPHVPTPQDAEQGPPFHALGPHLSARELDERRQQVHRLHESAVRRAAGGVRLR